MAQIATVEKQNTKGKQTQSAKASKHAVAHANYLRVSPRKMRLITNLVKNMYASDAIQQLQFTPKKGSKMLIDLIRSAVANAQNNFKMNKDNLFIVSITCDAGPKLKRYMARAQGSAHEIRRPTSHLHVILEERISGKKNRKSTVRFTKKEPKAAEVEVRDGKAAEEKGKIQHSQVDKTEQQVKANKVQQKRRLFNRKSGV